MDIKDTEQAPDVIAEISPEEQELIYKRAQRYASRRLGLQIHAMIYGLVILVLLAINALATPHIWWALWPAFAWGLGIGMHWYIIAHLLPNYQATKEREIVRQLGLRNS